MPTPTIEFNDVTFGTNGIYDSSVSGITLAVEPGELALVLLEEERIHLPLADLAVGILEPDKGGVRYHGTNWLARTLDKAANMRGHIGRVFEGNPWIDGIDLSQSIMLAQLHHTCRPISDITRQAAEFSRVFGLPGLPLNLPSAVHCKDLARAACVRAFMGKPDLFVLERPNEGVYPELLPALLNALHDARQRGAAVLWLTDNPAIWNNPGVHPTLRSRMYGARMCVD
jgi:phospholipid/cholesterol/gamma-HCH transport system ATP-binding protein